MSQNTRRQGGTGHLGAPKGAPSMSKAPKSVSGSGARTAVSAVHGVPNAKHKRTDDGVHPGTGSNDTVPNAKQSRAKPVSKPKPGNIIRGKRDGDVVVFELPGEQPDVVELKGLSNAIKKSIAGGFFKLDENGEVVSYTAYFESGLVEDRFQRMLALASSNRALGCGVFPVPDQPGVCIVSSRYTLGSVCQALQVIEQLRTRCNPQTTDKSRSVVKEIPRCVTLEQTQELMTVDEWMYPMVEVKVEETDRGSKLIISGPGSQVRAVDRLITEKVAEYVAKDAEEHEATLKRMGLRVKIRTVSKADKAAAARIAKEAARRGDDDDVSGWNTAMTPEEKAFVLSQQEEQEEQEGPEHPDDGSDVSEEDGSEYDEDDDAVDRELGEFLGMCFEPGETLRSVNQGCALRTRLDQRLAMEARRQETDTSKQADDGEVNKPASSRKTGKQQSVQAMITESTTDPTVVTGASGKKPTKAQGPKNPADAPWRLPAPGTKRAVSLKRGIGGKH
ncbi:MAG: hypothetical protein EBU90_26845 [Proteobacteria bacterium]|nr:hypothetical protein [Pseudomonadota bacterium]